MTRTTRFSHGRRSLPALPSRCSSTRNAIRSPLSSVLPSLDRPVRVFPLFANALRFKSGRSIEDDAVFVSEMWAKFSDVASRNPYAWSRTARTAEEIRSDRA